MKDRHPTNEAIKEIVEQILEAADLEEMTMNTVYHQVYDHYPDFDLSYKKDFIKATIKSYINLEPTTAEMEKLVKFLEDYPELAAGTILANNNTQENIQMTLKWEAMANELHLLGGVKRSGESWADFWYVLRSHLSQIIAARRTGARGGIIQPYTPAMMERMITLLERSGYEETPAVTFGTAAESPSTSRRRRTARRSVEIEGGLNPESSGNAPGTGEDPASSRAAARAARRAARRSRRIRRHRARALRPRPYSTLRRLIKIEEGRLQVNLKSAEILNSLGATAEKLGAFIAACGHKIASEIERRNTPN